MLIKFCNNVTSWKRILLLFALLSLTAFLVVEQLAGSTTSVHRLYARVRSTPRNSTLEPGPHLVEEAAAQASDVKGHRTTMPTTSTRRSPLTASTRRSPPEATTTTTSTPATSTPQTTSTAKLTTQGQITNSSMSLRDQMNAKLRYFKPVEGQRETFLYSAIANFREPIRGQLNIIVNAFDSTNTSQFTCCIYLQNNSLITTQGNLYYTHGESKSIQISRQYICVLGGNLNASYVTLTSSSCPSSREKYMNVQYQQIVPGGVAICGKILYGKELNPNLLLEWFEVQRLLGVDRILILDLDNPEPIQRVFQHYVKTGLLELHRYELPGPPYGRGLHESQRLRMAQFFEDETLPFLNCRQVLGGYEYVVSIDVDEILLPRNNQTLKAFLSQQMKRHPDAAGFVFKVQFFFLFEWEAVDNSSDITFFRFLNSTFPRMECYKHAYRPDRVFQAFIHNFNERAPYHEYRPPQWEATLLHYRKCTSKTWKTCKEPRMTDRSMLRFKGILEDNVKVARKATGISPSTHPTSSPLTSRAHH